MQSQSAKIIPIAAKPFHQPSQPASADASPFKPLQALEQSPREWGQHPLNPVMCWAGIFCVGAALWLAAFRVAGLL